MVVMTVPTLSGGSRMVEPGPPASEPHMHAIRMDSHTHEDYLPHVARRETRSPHPSRPLPPGVGPRSPDPRRRHRTATQRQTTS